jgi:hypothetical protein
MPHLRPTVVRCVTGKWLLALPPKHTLPRDRHKVRTNVVKLDEDVPRYLTICVEEHEEGSSTVLRKDQRVELPFGDDPDRRRVRAAGPLS